MVLGQWEHAREHPYRHAYRLPRSRASPPFEPAIRAGRIYARDAGDNKGQHFAQLLAIESYLGVHGRLPCNVTILLEGEEELGSPNIANFVRTHRDLLKSDLVITADVPLHESGCPIISFGRGGRRI